MSLMLKKVLSGSIKQRLRPHYIKLANHYHYWNMKSLRPLKKIIFFGTPEHDNLGDHAIAYAMHKFLREQLPDYKIIEVSTYRYAVYLEALQKCVNHNDIIVLSGGGNFGDQYLDEENMRRAVISTFKHNKIILFPQTVFFSKSETGMREFARSRDVYSQHGQLFLVARETYSYEVLKENFPKNEILLTPDIVFYLDETNSEVERKGALVCLRNDVEGVLPPDQIDNIKQVCRMAFDSVVVTDTVTFKRIPVERREQELRMKWDEFRKAEVVITDRLHGMVFAAITGTPCIVLSNYNYKVRGTYDWIKHLDHIIFTDEPNTIPDHIRKLKAKGAHKCSFSLPNDAFHAIKSVLS